MKSPSALSRIRFITLLAITTQLGCTAVSVPKMAAQVPGAWSAQADPAGRPVDLRSWWKALDDSRLNGLVEEALHHNLDLAQSARLLEAERQLAGRANARFLPWLTGGARPAKDAAARDSYFNVGLDMAWELGLFGAAESGRILAQAQLERAEARQQALRVSLVAAVVRNYLDLGVANGQIEILRQIQALDSKAERFTLTRLNTHLGSQKEVDAANLQRWQTQSELAAMRLTADRSARALALLLGRSDPDPEWRKIVQPSALTSFALHAIPADLLRTRPDIGEAEAEVLRAAASLGIAHAAMYPRLSLGGSILYSYNVTQNRRSNSNFVPSVGPTIDIPLWDWGMRRAQVVASERGIDAALLGYQQAVLTGVSEVEEALSSLERLREQVQALEKAGQAQARRVAAQRQLAALGLSSDAETLAESRSFLEARAKIELAQGSRALAFVALYKALGGAPLDKSWEANP